MEKYIENKIKTIDEKIKKTIERGGNCNSLIALRARLTSQRGN